MGYLLRTDACFLLFVHAAIPCGSHRSTGWHARVVQSSTIVCTKHLYLKVDSGLAMAPSNRVAVGCLLALLRLCLAACVVIEIPLATRDSLFIKSLVVEESPEGSLQVNLEGVVHNVEAGEARGALESPLVRTIDANIEAAAGEFCSLHLGHLGDKGEDCARTVGVIARRELEARRSNGETDEGLVWNVVSYVKKGSHATSLLDRIERLTSGLTGEVSAEEAMRRQRGRAHIPLSLFLGLFTTT